MERVSVIMPAYGAQGTLHYAVDSVLRQTHRDWELLIISDDGTDYVELLGKQGIADTRIRGLSTGRTGSGPSAARNVGLAAARGRYVALLDADDVWLSEKLCRSLPFVRQHGWVATAIDEVVLSEEGHFEAVRTNATPGRSRLVDPDEYCLLNFSANAVVVYDRSRVPARFREDLFVYEDLVFALSAYDHLESTYFLDEPLHLYVTRQGSAVRSPESSTRFIEAKKRLLQWAEAKVIFRSDGPRQALARLLTFSLDLEERYEADPAEPFQAFLMRAYRERGVELRLRDLQPTRRVWTLPAPLPTDR